MIDDTGSITGVLASGAVTDDAKPEIKGAAEAGATVNVFDNGTLLGSTVADANGAWSFTPATPLVAGSHNLTAQAVDAAGNPSGVSPSFDFTLIGSGAPAAPTILNVIDDAGTVIGNVEKSTGVSNDAKPEIKGTAEAGATISVYDGATLLGSTLADGTGNWSFTPATALADGMHTISATATNAAGNTSPATGIYDFTVDTGLPAAPTVTSTLDNAGLVTGQISNGMVTDDQTPSLSGTGEPGATVKVYDGANLLGSTVVGPDGNWNYTPTSALGNGNHSLTTTQTDPAGNTGPASAAVSFTVDTSAVTSPSITTVQDNQGTIQGAVAENSSTDDRQPTITGTAPAGTTIRVYDGAAELGSTVTDAFGNWSYTPAAALADGPHSFTATATNAAGTVSPATAAYVVTVDTLAPNAPVISGAADDVGSLQGPVASGSKTDDPTPTLSGTGEAGSTIKIFDGANLLGTTSVAPNGTWNFTPASGLAAGVHNFTAVSVDAAGNSSLSSAPYALELDFTAPNAPAITSFADDVGNVQGLLLSGSLTDDSLPRINGTGEANSTIQIYDAGILLGSALVDAAGSWNFTPAASLSEGAHTFTATSTDAAGNTSLSSPVASLTVDTTAPVAQILLDSITADNVLAQGEAAGLVSVTGKVAYDVSQGDSIILTVNGHQYSGAVLADKTFSISVNGSDLQNAADRTVHVQVSSADVAGNVTVAKDFKSYNVTATITDDGARSSAFDDTASKVYATSDGGYWQFFSSNAAAGGANNYELYAQKYDASGHQVGSTVTVVSSPVQSGVATVSGNLEMQQFDTTLYESPPVIAALADGRFIAVWSKNGLSDDTNTMKLQARIFNADGTPSTNEFQVGTWAVDGTDAYDVPTFTVTQLAGGNVVVGYVRSAAEVGGDEPVFTVLNTSGAPVSQNIEIQEFDTTALESPPVIQAMADGRFIAVWCKNGLSDDTTTMKIQARIFNADGTPGSNEFQVGTWGVDGSDGYDVPSMTVTQLLGGQIVIAYERNFAESTGGDQPVFAVVDPATATVTASDLLMQQIDAAGLESPPVIEALADGRFIAVWYNNALTDNSTSMLVQGRIFNADGSAASSQFQIGTWAIDGFDVYDVPSLTVTQLAGGNVVVAYVRSSLEAAGDAPVFSVLGVTNNLVGVVAQNIEMQQYDTSIYESPPVIQALADGRFIAVWCKNGVADDTTSMTVQGRIFNADGSASTDEFQVGMVAVDGSDGFDVPNITVEQLTGGEVVVGWVRSAAEAGGNEPVYVMLNVNGSANAGGAYDIAGGLTNIYAYDVAVLADGSFNVYYTQGGDHAGYLAHYSSSGALIGEPLAVPGPKLGTISFTNSMEMQQNDLTGTESPPVMHALADGRFVAVWCRDALLDNARSMTVHGRIFNANGTPSGDEFQVGTWAVDGTDGYDVPSVTVTQLSGGNIVVGYVRSNADVGGDEPVFTVLDADGATVLQNVEMQEFDTTAFESPPLIQALADGRFIAVWCKNGLSDDTTTMRVQARIFNADGTASSGEFQVGTWGVDGSDGYDVPSMTVTQLVGGQIVIAYERNYAAESTSGDQPVFAVVDPVTATVTASDLVMQQIDAVGLESPPVIQALADGRFIAVWSRNGLSDDLSTMKVEARIFNADGTASTGEFQVGSWAIDGYDGYDVQSMTVTQLTGGNVVVAYIRSTAEVDDDEAVFAVINPTTGLVLASNIEMQQNDTTTFESPPVIQALSDGRFIAVWYKNATSDNNTTMTVQGRVFNADGTPNTNEFQVGHWAVDGSDGFDVPNLSVIQLSGGQIVVGYVRSGAEVGGEEPVYAMLKVSGEQIDPTMVRMSDGSSVLLYASDTGSGYALYQVRVDSSGQLLDANPVRVGDATAVSSGFAADLSAIVGTQTGQTFSLGADGLSAVDLGNGKYAVTYMEVADTALKDANLYVKVYDFATGQQVGNTQLVTSNTTGIQFAPETTVLSNGDLLMTWASNHSATGTMAGFDLYSRRFRNVGGVLLAQDAADVLISTDSSGSNGTLAGAISGQHAVSAMSDGGYVVAWTKALSDTQTEIYAQRYDAAGHKVGEETLLSATTGAAELRPSVSGLADGSGYVVSWTTNDQAATELTATAANWTHNADNVVSVMVKASGNFIFGSEADDVLTGSANSDVIHGGAGADTLTGGLGVDIFKWTLADAGTAGSPVRDVITDFTKGDPGDVLDLRDLLQGEHEGDLGKYLHFTESAGSALIQISSTGGFNGSNYGSVADQEILLQGLSQASLAGAGATDAQIIAELLKTNLKVDM